PSRASDPRGLGDPLAVRSPAVGAALPRAGRLVLRALTAAPLRVLRSIRAVHGTGRAPGGRLPYRTVPGHAEARLRSGARIPRRLTAGRTLWLRATKSRA